MATINLPTGMSALKSEATKLSDRFSSKHLTDFLPLSRTRKRSMCKESFTVRAMKIAEQSHDADLSSQNGPLNGFGKEGLRGRVMGFGGGQQRWGMGHRKVDDEGVLGRRWREAEEDKLNSSIVLQPSDTVEQASTTSNAQRKTKIVCTIGPSTSSREMIWKLVETGMNVARLNMSHGDHASHQKTIDLVKEYNAQFEDKVVAIMLDTKGPEVRSGDVPQPIMLKEGQEFNFTIKRGVSTENTVSVNYDDFVNDVAVGDTILVDGNHGIVEIDVFLLRQLYLDQAWRRGNNDLTFMSSDAYTKRYFLPAMKRCSPPAGKPQTAEGLISLLAALRRTSHLSNSLLGLQYSCGLYNCSKVYHCQPLPLQACLDLLLSTSGGMMSLAVKSKTKDSVKCEVIDGGELKSRRHLNVRGKSATLPSITDKDWEDIKFGVDNKVDFYAVSFVKDANVVHELKDYLRSCNADIHVIVKIESADSIPNLHSILTASDGAMVARGDLGAELPIEDVPLLQEDIIRRCRSMQKPVIVATNMLESMIGHPTPTRAEVSDIAIAVREGADAVMLSGETAHGNTMVTNAELNSKFEASSKDYEATKEDVAMLKEDFVIIKEDVATIKSDVHTIKTTLNGLKASMEMLLAAVLEKTNIQEQEDDSVKDFEETMKEQDEHAANIEDIEERKAKINLLTKESMKDHYDQCSKAKEAKENDENATELSTLQKKNEVHIEFIIPDKFDAVNGVMTTLNFLIFSLFVPNNQVKWYPLKAVKVMHTVALRTETSLPDSFNPPGQSTAHKVCISTTWKAKPPFFPGTSHMGEMFAFHATTMANTLATPIIVFTRTGSMAVLLSHYRPSSTIFAFTNEERVKQRLALYHGVMPIYMQFSDDAEETFSRALKLLQSKSLLKEGEHVTLVQSGAQPIWRRASTHHIQVRKVQAD
ncbi:hypothetical protein HYC85_001317 [Camellia sinensis]|uniref:pyruvate kinase n=1 Tax=Camellia sinensis TaxID=4442 RepID=A0A7J7I7J4_CAMSI|nr:hypothetical protein HYC85_001317 [Camellia sinensis]